MKTFNMWALASALTMTLAVAGPATAQGGSEVGGQSGQSGSGQSGSGQSGSGAGQVGGSGQAGGAGGTDTMSPHGPMGAQADAQRSQKDLQKFVEQAAISNLAEIQLGQLAQQKAQNPEVKQFAQMMIDEHTRAQNELQQAATSAGLSLPSSLDSKHQKMHDKLASLDGSHFDREYMKAMVKSHNDTRKLLEKRAGKSGDVAGNRAGAGGATDTSGGTMGTAGTSGSGSSGATAGTSGSTGAGSSAGAGTGSGSTAGTTAAGTSGEYSGAIGSTAGNATFSSIDEWAAAKLPAVQQHLDQAKDIEKRLKDEGKSNNSNDKNDK